MLAEAVQVADLAVVAEAPGKGRHETLALHPFIYIMSQPVDNHLLKPLIAHKFGKEFFIDIHAFDKQGFQQTTENQLKFIKNVCFSRLSGHVPSSGS